MAINAIHGEVKARRGRPRAHAERVAGGMPRGVHTVAGLRRAGGPAAETKPTFGGATDSSHGCPVAENIVDRRFVPAAPDRPGAAAITLIPTREGCLHLAVVLNLGTRPVVGWATADPLRAELAGSA